MAGYSFLSLEFSPAADNELVQGVQPPEPVYSLRWVANSNRAVLHKGGFKARTYQEKIRVDPSAVGDWEDAQLLTGDLEVDSIIWDNATLIQLTYLGRTPHSEYAYFNAQWVIMPGV